MTMKRCHKCGCAIATGWVTRHEGKDYHSYCAIRAAWDEVRETFTTEAEQIEELLK